MKLYIIYIAITEIYFKINNADFELMFCRKECICLFLIILVVYYITI